MRKYCPLLHIILSCLFLYCLGALYYDTSIYATYQNYNILTIPVLFGLAYLMYKGWNLYFNLSKRRCIFLLCGILFACFYVCGTRVMIYGCIELTSLSTWLFIAIFSYAMTAFIILLYQCILPLLHKYLYCHSYPHIDLIISKAGFPLIWLCILLCWIPILLACYPGIFSYDAIYQCSQVTESLHLNTHHPIIHTLFLGGCIQLGKSFFHSANTGMLIYSIIQMLINSCIFAYIITFLKRQKVSGIVTLLCFLFFAIIPFNGLFAICATKDSIFSAIFALLFILYYRLVKDKDYFFSSWKFPLLFSFTAFTAITFRNNMLYAFILCIPFLLIIYRKYWKKNIIMLLLPVLLLQVYEGILYPALHVTPGNSREAYSVFMQQYAYVYNTCDLDDHDKTLLLGLMNDEDWKKYEPHKSDIIKNEFNTNVFEENLSEYMKLWLDLGIHHPSQYINAFLNLTYGYWYPNDALPDNTTYRKYIEVYTGGDVTFESKLPWLLERLQKFGMDSSYQSIPCFSMIFNPAFYLWILLFLTAVSIYERKYRFLMLMLLPAALFASILFGPVALLRYAYPIILCVPSICALYGNISANDNHNVEIS